MQRRLPVQVCCPATRPALPTATWRSAPRHEPASRSAASPPRPGAPGRRRRPQPRAPPPPPPSCAPAVPRCGVQGQGGRQQGSDVTLTLEELHPPLATFLRCWQAEGCATGGQAVHPRSLSKHRQQAPPDADSCTHPAASQHPRANTNQSDNAQDAQPPTLTPALPRAAPSAAAQHPAEPPAALRDERLPPGGAAAGAQRRFCGDDGAPRSALTLIRSLPLLLLCCTSPGGGHLSTMAGRRNGGEPGGRRSSSRALQEEAGDDVRHDHRFMLDGLLEGGRQRRRSPWSLWETLGAGAPSVHDNAPPTAASRRHCTHLAPQQHSAEQLHRHVTPERRAANAQRLLALLARQGEGLVGEEGQPRLGRLASLPSHVCTVRKKRGLGNTEGRLRLGRGAQWVRKCMVCEADFALLLLVTYS